MYKNEDLKRLNNSVTYENGNEKWEKSYELTEKHFLMSCQVNIQKINYYWFNRQETLQKAKEKYYIEKAAEYYKQKKESIKEKSRERYKNLPQEKKGQD